MELKESGDVPDVLGEVLRVVDVSESVNERENDVTKVTATTTKKID